MARVLKHGVADTVGVDQDQTCEEKKTGSDLQGLERDPDLAKIGGQYLLIQLEITCNFSINC